MKTMLRRLATAGLVLACTAPLALAQKSAQQNQGASQPWMQFEKELGLQTTYSVDMVMESSGVSMDSRIFRSGGKTRTEMTMPMMNLRMVGLEIPEGGKTVSYAVFPDQKKYVINEAAGAAGPGAKPQIEELGTETFAGEACVKRRVTMEHQGIRSEMIMLFSPRQKNMPVKMTVNAAAPIEPGRPPRAVQSTILFKNYDFSAPADSLFVLPAGYTQAASMMEIMMGGGAAQGLGALMKQMQPRAPAK